MIEAYWLACEDPMPMLGFLRDRASARKSRLFACACVRRVSHLLTHPAPLHALAVAERLADGSATEEERCRAREAASELGGYDELGWAVGCAVTGVRIAAGGDRDLDWGYEARCINPIGVPTSPHARAAAAAQSCARAVGWEGVGAREERLAARPFWVRGWVAARRRLLGIPSWAACEESRSKEFAAQARLLRDVFGNPLRSIALDPAWLTPNVVALARTIYEERELPSGHLDLTRLAILGDALMDAGCDSADILAHCHFPGPHVRGCWVIDLILGKQ